MVAAVPVSVSVPVVSVLTSVVVVSLLVGCDGVIPPRLSIGFGVFGNYRLQGVSISMALVLNAPP